MLFQIRVYLLWLIVFFEYKNNFFVATNNVSALLHFIQFFAVSENGSTDWSWICWQYIACGFGIDWGLISAKRCQIDWLSQWIAAANDSHRAEEIKESAFFLTSRRIAKCLIYEPLKEKSIFSTFHWLSARKKLYYVSSRIITNKTISQLENPALPEPKWNKQHFIETRIS